MAVKPRFRGRSCTAEVAARSRASVGLQYPKRQRRDRDRNPRNDGDRSGAQRVMALLAGIGADSAWTLSREVFGRRQFYNRRELSGCLGPAPTPCGNGTSRAEHQQYWQLVSPMADFRTCSETLIRSPPASKALQVTLNLCTSLYAIELTAPGVDLKLAALSVAGSFAIHPSSVSAHACSIVLR